MAFSRSQARSISTTVVPRPASFRPQVENLREIRPTGFGCVPGVYGMLAEALEHDADLRQKFFSNLRWLSYGGALLPQPLWERMQRLAVQELGERLPFGTGWGMTETAATGVAVYWNTNRTGLVGLPQPGVMLKLVPTTDDRMELRIKGPHICPPTTAHPSSTRRRSTKRVFPNRRCRTLGRSAHPIEGLEYAGRMAEDFKLLSGTWVQASIVRRDLVAALAPFVSDAVITAPNHPLARRAGLAHRSRRRQGSRRARAEARGLQCQPPGQCRHDRARAGSDNAAIGRGRRGHGQALDQSASRHGKTSH